MQIDEPAPIIDLIPNELASQRLNAASPIKILIASYFGDLSNNLETALSLPVAGLHIDLAQGADQLTKVVSKARKDQVLSLGVLDGRNIWRADLSTIIDRIQPVIDKRGLETIEISPSCSLLHVPIDLELETALDDELKSWLAFATQKIKELSIIGRALTSGQSAVLADLKASSEAISARATSPRVHNAAVHERIADITEAQKQRQSAFAKRQKLQSAKLGLPDFPTTTIGSFPQTAAHGKGDISHEQYEGFIQCETEAAIRWQEEIGLDVLVHGEFERNDIVQYFGEQLSGFAFTQHAWV